MKFLYTSFASILVACTVSAQTLPAFTPASERMKSTEQRQKLSEASILKNIPFRSVGPTVMSGRVVDIDVNPKDPSVFYVCYASGGLWKTESNGSSFTPLFDKETVMTLGDMAVNWDKNIIWLGTGENNASRSSYAGAGIYKSMDGGKTWKNMGLEETHHIGRIVLHPQNPDVAWVAALGHLYSSNKERGVYKTTDGGKTWKQTLFVDDNSGAIDIVVDEKNPQTLYASTWQKERKAWMFEESGKGTGIYKSTDGGNTWNLVSSASTGFPSGENAGRIGLALANVDGKTVVFANIDNQAPVSKKKEESADALTKEKIKDMSKEDFLKLDKKVVNTFLRSNGFPEKYKANDIIDMVKSDKIKVQTLYDYIDNGDDGFSNKGILQSEVFRSDDGGKTWKRTHTEGAMKDLFSTYGYYFAQIRVNPSNPNKLYVLGTRIVKSDDAGKTWKSINRENVHWDHHALWVNPNRAGHLINGNDGGINISYDDGKTWIKCNSPAVGQFYHINVDMAEPYNVYGGLQDNGVWYSSSAVEIDNDWHDSGENPYKRLAGGDGMQVMIDTRDNATVYTGSQFGFYMRLNTKTKGRPKFIQPRHILGEKPLRFNWQTPIWLSQHNQDVLYYGANKLYRSLDKGDNWEAISDDLTMGAQKGNVPYGTLTTITESSFKFGLLYTGSDDGLVHVSKDGGNTWKKITEGLPKNMWVSRVIASAHDKATVYTTLNGYRWDDFKPYIFISKNYGDTWEKIGLDLPNEPINVVKEDPKNPNILYVGTDHGLYVSLDKGQSFMTMDKNLPSVAVHDVVVHPRDKELVVGTHGRSLYIADVAPLQQLTADNLAKELVVFDLKKMRNFGWGRQGDNFTERDEVAVKLPIYVKSSGTVSIKVKTKDILLKEMTAQVTKGINYVDYNLTHNDSVNTQYQTWLNDNQTEKDAAKIEVKPADDGKLYLKKGKYTVEVEKNGVKSEKELIIE